MAENKELGLDNLKDVNWLNENAPGSAIVEEETQTEVAAEEPATNEVVEEESIDVEANEEAVEQTESPLEEDSAEEISSNQEPTQESVEEESIIQTLSSKLGYEIEGNFSDDFDGLSEYTSAVAGKMAEEHLDNLFNQYPDVKEYFQYRANNGDPIKYFQAQQQELDYKNIEISDNVAIQKRVVQDGMRVQGFGEEEITRMTNAYEDAGILKDNAEVYLQQLQKKQVEYKTQLLENQEKEAEKQREQATQYWNAVSDTIKTGQLRGMQIPTKQRKDFYDWMTTPVQQNGVTQRDMDRSKMDLETALALEYLIYQGFDLSKLAKNVSNTKKAQSLKERLQSKPSASTRMKSRSKSTVSKTVSIPNLRDLL